MLRFVLSLAGPLVLAGIAEASTLYVDAGREVGGDGLTWETAFGTLQDALSAAALPESGVSDIRVADGVYRPDRDAASPDGTGVREATFALVSGVTIRGGYGGISKPDPDVRDLEFFESILSGDLAGNDVAGPAGTFIRTDENSHHVLTSSGGGPTIDGFVIEGGNSAGSASATGGGLRIEFAGGTDVVTLRNLQVRRNQGTVGGGLWCDANALVIDCTFQDNLAERGGGAAFGIGDMTVQGCSFELNQAGSGGGVSLEAGSTAIVLDCTIRLNQADASGGGMDVQEFSIGHIVRSTIEQNIAGSRGGGIAFGFESYGQVVNATIRANSASTGGGIAADNTLPLCVTNSVIAGNSALDAGGGIWWLDSFVTLINVTLHANAADQGGGLFGTTDFYNDFISLTSCILWDNTAATSGSQIALGLGPFGAGEIDSLIVEACDVKGGETDINLIAPSAWFLDWDEANIDADPLFTDPDGPDKTPDSGDEDLSLLAGSPCIDAGLETALPPDDFDLDGDGDTLEAHPIDLIGAPRVGPGTCEPDAVPALDMLDMGAFEHVPDCCPADFDGNDEVGFVDLVMLLVVWGPCIDDCAADLDLDGTVGFGDLELVIASWGACPTLP